MQQVVAIMHPTEQPKLNFISLLKCFVRTVQSFTYLHKKRTAKFRRIPTQILWKLFRTQLIAKQWNRMNVIIFEKLNTLKVVNNCSRYYSIISVYNGRKCLEQRRRRAFKAWHLDSQQRHLSYKASVTFTFGTGCSKHEALDDELSKPRTIYGRKAQETISSLKVDYSSVTGAFVARSLVRVQMKKFSSDDFLW